MKEISFPKISIITPNFNGAIYLEETILSVLGQNYPNLEYIIVDGGSSDGSIEIIKKYEKQLTWWISEPDNGMYHAIQKGFDRSTGEFMAWINSDDMYHIKSFYTVAEIFSSFQQVNWLVGASTCYDEFGRTVFCNQSRKFTKFDFYNHDFKWIQQESVFWRRNLWNMAGGFISTDYKYAGDLELWNRFFRYEKLYTPNCLIGGFRLRSTNQLSLDFYKEYIEEAEEILKNNQLDRSTLRTVKKIHFLNKLKLFLRWSRIFRHKDLLQIIENKIIKLNEFPAVISFDRVNQRFSL